MKKFLLFVPIVLFIIGCGGGERASIVGSVGCHWYADSLVKSGYIEGYKYNGFKIIPLITINKDTLPIEFFDIGPTEFYYSGHITGINHGDQYELKVDYGDGKGEVTDTLPGEFSIISPDTSFVLHKGNDLNITWGSSKGADWYWLDLEIDYDYKDTAGNWHSFYFYLDTIIDGTSYTVSKTELFPADVDSIYWSDGNVYVRAYSGPKMEPGVESNIKGNAVGFFWGYYNAKSVDFDIEELAANKPEEDRQAEINKRHLEAMRKFADENQ